MTTRRGRSLAAVAITGLAVLAGCSGTEGISQPGGPDGPGALNLDDVRLISYDSCDGLLDWFHQEASDRVGPYGLDGVSGYAGRGVADSSSTGAPTSSSAASGAALPQSSSSFGSASDEAGSTSSGSSTTNTQEPGIGEPDLTWTDGTRLVTVVGGRLRIVDLDSGRVTATVELPDDSSGSSPTGLLVDGDHALVIQPSYGYVTYDGPMASDGVASSMPAQSAPVTRLTRVDLGADPTVVGSVSVDGEYVDARMVDGVVRAVVRSSPAQLGFVYPSGNGKAAMERATAANREVVAESTLDDWLPTMTVEADGREGSSRRAVDCAAVDHPSSFGGFGVVTVVGLDLGAGAVDPLPSAAVVADAQTVYASSDALYLATPRYPSYEEPGATPGSTTPTTGARPDDQVRTDVHAFSLPADVAARYEASGSVPGTLLDQFALSEHDGDLRVATTTDPTGWSERLQLPITEDGVTTAQRPATAATAPAVRESRVTVLRREGDALTTVGQVVGLGPTEQIRGVRFSGPTAYVVTFRQTDPLYVVDLSDPTAPRVAGELKIPGFSAYLQEVGPGRVIGIGQDATDTGRRTGFQESLFDVSDPASPQRLAQLVVPNGSSTAESDHHAVLWWGPQQLLAVPVQSWVSGDDTSGVLVTRVTDEGITEVGTITHPPTAGGSGGRACPPGASCAMPAAPEYVVTSPTQIERTLVADGKLVTVSTAGVKVTDMATLADVSWTAF